MMAVMLVSYIQGAKGNKGVSYKNATVTLLCVYAACDGWW
jgi:hypothetical protein